MWSRSRYVMSERSWSVLALAIVSAALVMTVTACSCGSLLTTTTESVVADSTTVSEDTTEVAGDSTTTQTSTTEQSTSSTSSSSSSTTSPSSTTSSTAGMTMPSLMTSISIGFIPVQWTHIEEDNSALHYTGTWMGKLDFVAGCVVRTTTDPGAKAEILFDGTQVRLISLTGPGMGRAKLTLDGSGPIYVELYAAEGASEIVWTSGTLTDGPHTLKIEWSGAKDPASTGTMINIDAIEVIGVVAI